MKRIKTIFSFSGINVVPYAIKSSHLNDEHDYIVENIEPEETADLLLEEYVISHLDHEEIVNPQFHKSRRTMAKEMIKKLLDKDQDALNLFLFVLEHTDNGRNGNVAQKLKSISGKEKEKTSFFGKSKKKGNISSFLIYYENNIVQYTLTKNSI